MKEQKIKKEPGHDDCSCQFDETNCKACPARPAISRERQDELRKIAEGLGKEVKKRRDF